MKSGAMEYLWIYTRITKIRLFPGIVTKIDFLPYVQGQPLPVEASWCLD